MIWSCFGGTTHFEVMKRDLFASGEFHNLHIYVSATISLEKYQVGNVEEQFKRLIVLDIHINQDMSFNPLLGSATPPTPRHVLFCTSSPQSFDE
jgi:hypothetical protein